MRIRVWLILLAFFATTFAPVSLSSASALAGGFASAPRSISQSAVAGGVALSWSAPADVGNGILNYRIQQSSTGLNDGGWSDVATPASSPHTVLGLANSAVYLRIAAVTSAGTGAYGYPWATVYKTTTKTRSGTSIVYDINNSGTVSSSFTRVRYLFENTISTASNFADVDFYKWAQGGTVATTISTSVTAQPTISNLQVPSPAVPFTVQANVSDLTVYSSVASTGSYSNSITNGFGINGRLELWGSDYQTNQNGLSPAGNTNIYDYDDRPSAGSYGSFQVHNMDQLKSVFVWNQHGSATPDIGFGDGAGIASHNDWTFCGGSSCPNVTTFGLTIYVNSPITPLPDSTPPTVSRIDARSIAKNGDTLTVRSNELGTVHLVNQSVSVTNLASIIAAASANKNSVSISAVNTNTVLTLSALNDGLYNLYAADSAGNLSSAIIATIRIDNTPPTISSITVGSTGSNVAITANETITTSLQAFGIFSLTDSGSAISVNSIAVSGFVANLTLSRAIPANATVYFTYSPSAGLAAGRLVDLAGNEVAAITSRPVTNNSSSPINVILTVSNPLSKGSSTTITATVSVAGRVTFTIADKRIPGCLNKVASGNTPISVTCSFKPALTAQQTIRATLVPSIGAYPTTIASVDRFILKRTTTR
jgi:hypothetical protein